MGNFADKRVVCARSDENVVEGEGNLCAVLVKEGQRSIGGDGDGRIYRPGRQIYRWTAFPQSNGNAFSIA